MKQISVYCLYFLNVMAILGGGVEGHTLFRTLPELVQSTSVSLLRHIDHLTSAE